MKTCEGCRFLPCKATSKRCLVCSRNYADKYQDPPPPKPLSHKQKMELAQLGAIAGTLLRGGCYVRTKNGIEPYHPTK